MFIESIELLNYRNYKQLHIDFHEGTNVLYGDNAQGKTNILESVYVCSTTKSHRGSKDREIVQFGQEESHIKMIVRRDGVPYRIDMHLKKNKARGIAVNGIPIKKSSELFGIVNVIFFSPEDLNIIKNGPSERRRFIDLELCQLNRLYVYYLVQFNKVIIQRNKLLKEIDFNPPLIDTLDLWDAQLVRFGRELIRLRASFIEELNEIIYGIHFHLSGNKETLTVKYEPNTAETDLEKALKKNRPQELRQKMTLTGPHRDDLNFIINETDIRKFGSQGQQRTAALSLKLAEIELVKKTVKDYPVLLLDDVLSELDKKRQEHLLSEIRHIQTIITCTGLDEFVSSKFQMNKTFKIVNGAVESETE
ncbi:MAG: DNA replication/repair protein RecF [Lachnospiraceae bacterium]|jgi:DNA replication and repair protein RecF|nr:DNA replication/repair protein RecF [Lachnospiraceae bacterium]NBJ83682.1 DNA replication/repair protein RecF [bacterium 1XD42-76]NBK06995.1 DNA replication/repair protein RecF [bacterium 1XD42-94]